MTSESEKRRAATKKPRSGTKTGKGRATTKRPRKATTSPPDPGPASPASPVRSASPGTSSTGKSVAVFESGNANQQRAVAVTQALGYTVFQETEVDAMRRRIGESSPDILLVGAPGGENLVQAISKLGDARPVVVAALPGPATTAPARCGAFGADLYVIRPLSNDGLSATLHSALAVAAERDRVRTLRAGEEVLRQRLLRYGQADSATGFQHFDFFKRILVMELKRAKRYGYSLAVCLVAIDPRKPGEPDPSPDAARKLRTRVASAISSSIRDIDLPIDYADDRMLVFLPYTDIEGATSVGQRVAGAVRSYGTISDAGHPVSMTVSVGIAALRPGKPVSFARLMKEAGAAVRAAQLKGGSRIVVRK